MTPKWTVPPMDLEESTFDRYKVAGILRNAEREVLNGNITNFDDLAQYLNERLYAPALR